MILEEKQREDRIRDIPKRFTRWRWKTGVDPDQLKFHLRLLGLPLGLPWALD